MHCILVCLWLLKGWRTHHDLQAVKCRIITTKTTPTNYHCYYVNCKFTQLMITCLPRLHHHSALSTFATTLLLFCYILFYLFITNIVVISVITNPLHHHHHNCFLNRLFSYFCCYSYFFFYLHIVIEINKIIIPISTTTATKTWLPVLKQQTTKQKTTTINFSYMPFLNFILFNVSLFTMYSSLCLAHTSSLKKEFSSLI